MRVERESVFDKHCYCNKQEFRFHTQLFLRRYREHMKMRRGIGNEQDQYFQKNCLLYESKAYQSYNGKIVGVLDRF